MVSLLWALSLLSTQRTLGVATWYDTNRYNNDVYCLDATPQELMVQGVLWVAVDVREYQEGRIECGQWVTVTFGDGATLRAQALDAGPFEDYYVEDWPELPIIVDVPQHLWPLDGVMSSVVEMRVDE